ETVQHLVIHLLGSPGGGVPVVRTHYPIAQRLGTSARGFQVVQRRGQRRGETAFVVAREHPPPRAVLSDDLAVRWDAARHQRQAIRCSLEQRQRKALET